MGHTGHTGTARSRTEQIRSGQIMLEGELSVPVGATGVVLFAHGSGSGRHSPRNRFVAQQLRAAGLGTLLIDLLSEQEEAVDQFTGHLRFDIGLLAERLVGATDWLAEHRRSAGLSVGYFGASTGGGAALVAAAQRPDQVGAVFGKKHALGDFADLMAGPADALQTAGHRRRGLDLDHQIDRAHVDAQLQAGRGDDGAQAPALEVVLDLGALFLADRAVMRAGEEGGRPV